MIRMAISADQSLAGSGACARRDRRNRIIPRRRDLVRSPRVSRVEDNAG